MRSNQHQPADSSTDGAAHSVPTGWRRKLLPWILLLAYSAFLVGRAWWQNRAGDAAYAPVWEMQNSQRLLAWLGGLALASFWEFVCFIPVGFLAALAVPRSPRLLYRLPINLAAVVAAGTIAALVSVVQVWPSWHLGTVASLVPLLLGALLGAWTGTAWRRGRKARLWLLPKFAVLILIAILGAGILLWLSIEENPLPFEPAPVTSAEKRELVRRIRSKSPKSLPEGQTHTLRLTAHDVNVLLAWGLSLGSSERKAYVEFAPGEASFALSLGVPPGTGKPRYLNLQLAGDVRVNSGRLHLKMDRCRLGRLTIPSWLVNPWCPVIASQLAHDRRTKPFLNAMEEMAFGPNWIEATYTRVNLPPGFREDLFGPSTAGEKLLAATRAQVGHLLVAVEQLPRGERPSFGMCLQTAFTLAHDRSVAGNPVAENRAAIFALGTLLGHRHLEQFLGPVIPRRRHRSAQRALQRVEVRGRADWTKHFYVSAALTLLSDTLVSDAAGLFKEELDADVGGSGFSFADLLADRAGTTFADRATHNEGAARAMQARLAGGFQVDDFFPPAADLPEGISDAELQSQYGGVGGEAYLRLREEIERRIAACAAYR